VGAFPRTDLDPAKAEIARLKADLKRAEEERDILKKAAAYFADTRFPQTCSLVLVASEKRS
jgi:transposase-like protein